MDAIKKQASKLREQVAKQQQAVLRQFSGRFAVDPSLLEEPDAACYRQLQRLYKSTKAAKHFQRDILRGLEGLIAASSRQMEIASNLANACFRFGENGNSDTLLAKASLLFGNSHRSMEDEREKLHEILAGKVYQPLRQILIGAPLEDARHLAYCYEKLREEVEAQAIDVARRQMRSKDASTNPDYLSKLQNSEQRLHELGSALTALGREATTAMKSVAMNQRTITFQQLLDMVDAERSYHHKVASLLDILHDGMIVEKQKSDAEIPPELTPSTKDSCKIHEDLLENRENRIQVREINGGAQLEHSSGTQDLTEKEKFEKDESYNASGNEDQVVNDEIETDQCHNVHGDNEIEQKECGGTGTENENAEYFIAEVIHSFDAMGDGELNLSIGDFVVVRQESDNGWSEGESNGQAGWFPAAYVERRDRVQAHRVMDPCISTVIPPTPPPSSSS